MHFYSLVISIKLFQFSVLKKLVDLKRYKLFVANSGGGTKETLSSRPMFFRFYTIFREK